MGSQSNAGYAVKMYEAALQVLIEKNCQDILQSEKIQVQNKVLPFVLKKQGACGYL